MLSTKQQQANDPLQQMSEGKICLTNECPSTYYINQFG